MRILIPWEEVCHRCLRRERVPAHGLCPVCHVEVCRIMHANLNKPALCIGTRLGASYRAWRVVGRRGKKLRVRLITGRADEVMPIAREV